MKFLKYLLYIIGFLVLLAVVLGLVGPKTYDVNRSAVVPGTPEQVWPYVSSLKNTQLWSPWAAMDTNMAVEYSGTDGTVGSSSSWSGNKNVGKGKQTITALEPNTLVETELHFLEPMEGKSTGYTRLQDTTGGTQVTWGIRGENNFVGRIFGVLMNMDKMMGKDFESGLARLSEIVASGPAGGGNAIKPGQYPGGQYLGVRGAIAISEIEAFFGKNFGAAFEAVGKAGGTPAGPPSGLYYVWDMENGKTELAAAAPFTGDIKAPAGLEVITLPPSRSLTVDYYGGYHGMGAAHEAIDMYMESNNLEHVAPVIEEYITDPMSEPDSTKWQTRIVYFVK